MFADLLFNDGDLRSAFQNVTKKLVKEVESTPEQHLLQADEQEWAQALAERYSVAAPVLHTDQMWMEPPRDVQVDVSHEGFMRALPENGGPFHVPGYRVVIHIPFSGDYGVFKLQASQFSLNPPRAIVERDELKDVVEYPHDRKVNIKAQAEALATKVSRQLEWARRDIQRHNESLEQTALNAIRARRERVQQHRQHVEETGLPMRRPDGEAKTYISDALVRRPAPRLPTQDSERIVLEPALGAQVFEHILRVLRAAGEAMERSPETYKTMGEEDRRQVFLTALNTHYRGQASAEAFNVSGKTDIIVRHEGRNLFIAEFKFWSGVKAFVATLDQLFGYTAWRDTKLAVVVFVKERDLTAVIEKAREALAQHPQFVAWGEAGTETELRATVHWRGDERRLADLNLFFVHTPPA
jgi:hypothetical protein